MGHDLTKVVVSKQLNAINGAPVALSATKLPVKVLILRSELGSSAVYETDDVARVFATAGKIGSGGSLTIDVGVHKEIDLAKTFVQTSGAAVKLHVMALD